MMKHFLTIALVMILRTRSSYQQNCIIINNQSIALPDLATSYEQPQSNCCNICQNTPGCKGFAWNAYEGGTCWLKAGTGPLIDKVSVNVGILYGKSGGTSGGCSIKTNQGIDLPNLAAHQGQPQENCCSICSNTLGCKGFAWSAYYNGTCFLKAGTEPLVAMKYVNVGILHGTSGGTKKIFSIIEIIVFTYGIIINFKYLL